MDSNWAYATLSGLKPVTFAPPGQIVQPQTLRYNIKVRPLVSLEFLVPWADAVVLLQGSPLAHLLYSSGAVVVQQSATIFGRL